MIWVFLILYLLRKAQESYLSPLLCEVLFSEAYDESSLIHLFESRPPLMLLQFLT